MSTRRTVLAAAGIAGLAGLVAAGWRLFDRSAPATVATKPTAPVVRTDLFSREDIAGTLGYAGDWHISHPGNGFLTAAAEPGAVVKRGQVLYEVDGEPVYLLYGSRPAWRDLALGMTSGPDVRQLAANLSALGVGGPPGGSRFTTATAAAVRRWQARLHRPRTGHLPLGSVVFAPEALRIAEILVPIGERVGAGPVLRATSTRTVVTAALPSARQGEVAAGAAAEVTIAGGQPTAGHVTHVDRVAVAHADGPATLTVTVAVDRPVAALDQAPVLVTVVTAVRHGVLAVPLTALRAGAAGGYEVVVRDGGPVTVQPGLYDERAGLIEVSGNGLTAGASVEVAAA
jgi:hypothetical protein